MYPFQTHSKLKRHKPVFLDSPVIIPHGRYPRRKHWHTLQERFEKRSPIDKTLIDREVLVSRVIVRSGYMFEYPDCEPSYIANTVQEIMKKDLQSVMNVVSGSIPEENYYEAYRYLEELWGFSVTKNAMYEARRYWLAEAYKLPEFLGYRKLRTFWYVNLANVSPHPKQWFRVHSIKSHVLGIQYDAESYHYSGPEGEDYDYTPGGLSPSYFQKVYYSNFWRVWANNYDDYSSENIEIHPDDVLDIR